MVDFCGRKICTFPQSTAKLATFPQSTAKLATFDPTIKKSGFFHSFPTMIAKKCHSAEGDLESDNGTLLFFWFG